MYVIALCGPLESALEGLAKRFSQKSEIPITVLYESEIVSSLNLEELKKSEVVLVVGHRLYIEDQDGNSVEKILGKKFDMKLFLETAPDTCLSNFLRKNASENVFSNIEKYEQAIKPLNDAINLTKKFAEVVIPEQANHAVVLDLLCSKILTLNDEQKNEEQKSLGRLRLFHSN